ncbi:hypothetical protein ACFVMC_13100 [Nocardia sp. NPDC127579]|uniref:hypothetical protein n=1 Tax=Nocardia sp. NPDC127579 TaxID=3345402 RepID=UPI00362C53E2
MTEQSPWYVLEFNDGAWVLSGAGAVDTSSFAGALSARDGQRRASLRLWRAPEPPEDLSVFARAEARAHSVFAVGSATELTVRLDTGKASCQVGRPAEGGATRTVRCDLGRRVTVSDSEVFDAEAAAELFLAFYRTGALPEDRYALREIDAPDAPPTHGLTVDFDEQRAVLATVEAEEFAAFLGEDSTVLVLWPLPPEGTVAEFGDLEHPAFLQTAGSGGRYTVEIRRGNTLFTVGHQSEQLVWGSPLTAVAVHDNTVEVYHTEVFDPLEVGTLFQHYVRTGDIPAAGYTLRPIATL